MYTRSELLNKLNLELLINNNNNNLDTNNLLVNGHIINIDTLFEDILNLDPSILYTLDIDIYQDNTASINYSEC